MSPVSHCFAILCGIVIGFFLSTDRVSAAEPVGTAFSYQGRLLENTAPASGLYHLRFELFPSDSGGSSQVPALTNLAVTVSNGLFSTVLDFGTSVFSGARCWLEIGVRPANRPQDDFTILSPRQPLMPSPYAIYTLKAESLAGPLPDSQLSTNIARLDANQTFTGTVLFQGPVGIGSSNQLASLAVQGQIQAAAYLGNGAGLTNLTATTLSAQLAQRLWKVSIALVTVANAGNEPDANGKGAVAYPYRIGKFEVNNYQYAVFLNAVATDDPNRLYSSNMTANVHGGITRSGSPGAYVYTVKPGKTHHPVVWVDYHDALRFCNWLHHGQPTGPQDASTTEDGAYTLTPDAMFSNTVARNPGARFWLPSDDEWYKAAYYEPASGLDPSHYWYYPTRSDDAPFSEPPPGGQNSANVCCDLDYGSSEVGAYLEASSPGGTFDMAGNVQEWTEEIIYVTNRRLRGGSWNYHAGYARSTDFEFDTTDYDGDAIGFRVAGHAAP